MKEAAGSCAYSCFPVKWNPLLSVWKDKHEATAGALTAVNL
jgi:hypothetical protein